jgi:sugar lactone lactonase YvrE/uncharacterized protein YciI
MNPRHLLASMATFLTFAAAAQAPALPRHEAGATQLVPATEVAAWPENTFLESITPLPDGGLLVANKEGARVERIAPDGRRSLFASLPDNLTGLEYGVQGVVFATGREKGRPETVYRVAEGRAEVLVEIAAAKFLNGLTAISPRTLLVADSGAQTIWKVDVEARTATPWLVHELLGHRDAAHQFPGNTFIPGANGIKRFRDAVYVSSTDRGLVVRIPLRPDGSAGVPSVWARDVVVDDFAFDTDGNLYGTSHPLSTVVRIRPDGSRATIATGAQGVVGATAVAFGTRPGEERNLYVVGNARIRYQGASHPARLVKLEVGVPGYPRWHHGHDGAAVRQVGRLETWLVTAQTLPDSEEKRRAIAPAYTTYLEQQLDRIVLGGQLQDQPGGPAVARFYFLRAADPAAARSLIEASPYHQAGVYRVVDVKPATGMVGELMGGVAWAPRTGR